MFACFYYYYYYYLFLHFLELMIIMVDLPSYFLETHRYDCVNAFCDASSLARSLPFSLMAVAKKTFVALVEEDHGRTVTTPVPEVPATTGELQTKLKAIRTDAKTTRQALVESRKKDKEEGAMAASAQVQRWPRRRLYSASD